MKIALLCFKSEQMSLQNDIKGLAKDSAIYGLSSGLSRIIGLVMAPILTRIFSPSIMELFL